MKTFTEVYEFMMSVMGNVPFGVITIDLEGYITMVNESALENLDITKKSKELLDTPILQHLEEASELNGKIRTCLTKGRKPFDLEDFYFHNKYLTIRGRSILEGMIITTVDITEVKQSRLLATQSLLEGQESERRRLAQDIHDGLGPLLSTIRLNVESINTKGNFDQETHTRLEKVEELINEVTKDMRNISHALMPSAIVDFGLVTALENICKNIDTSEDLKVDFFCNNLEARLDQNMELGLFRITQELLNNALKYSEAKTIHLQLIHHGDSLVLTVEDDGVGFNIEKITKNQDKGIGLRNIETRVALLNGVFDLESSEGNGTFSTIEIPIE